MLLDGRYCCFKVAEGLDSLERAGGAPMVQRSPKTQIPPLRCGMTTQRVAGWHLKRKQDSTGIPLQLRNSGGREMDALRGGSLEAVG